MHEADWLARRFEEHRAHLLAVAYRMLGSRTDADDAVQESWLHVSRSDTSGVENLGGWLTTVTARVCLDMLRSRRSRPEEPVGAQPPDPVAGGAGDPEHEAVLADSVGLALLVVLDTLTPAERLAFVLHDMFAVPFDEIGRILDRTPTAARQVASRARRRVHGAEPPEADLADQREVVDAFLAAARDGDFAALLAVLDPDVVARADSGPDRAPREVRGAGPVAEQAHAFARRAEFARLALVNGSVGIVVAPNGRLVIALTFRIAGGRIAEIIIRTDPERLRELEVAVLDG
jgi:RNA polymerase sigma-70 factor, ECF subfamily